MKPQLYEKGILDIIEGSAAHPMTLEELSERLAIPKKKRKDFYQTVKNMAADGKLIKTKGDRYGIPHKMNLVTGSLQGHHDGYGFVIPEDENEEDVFISNKAMAGAMHGDKVVCRVEHISHGNKRDGSIIRILSRAHKDVVGVFEPSKHFGFVIPEERRLSQDIFIPKDGNPLNAKKGQVVVAKICRYPEKGRNPEGVIEEILGYPDSQEVEVDIVLRKYKIPIEFPQDVLNEADKLNERELSTEEKRLDLRDETIFTIDGETAKDFDDAVSIKILKNKNYLLGVHIADVSHYVTEGSCLDKEAYERGTSVYFTNSVVPMLPFKLSNELCSLKPKVDRLTISAVMEVNKSGKVVDYKISKSVIKSVERMTYTDVAKIINREDDEVCKKYSHIIKDIDIMKELCFILKEKRLHEGSIDFDLPEPYIIIDLQGKPENIIKLDRNIAHQLIEEFMLLANMVIAEHLLKLNIPSIYRIHEPPDQAKMADFNEFVYNLGYSIPYTKEGVESKPLQRLLSDIKGKPEERLINTILLRSMKQAKYSVNPLGHFGLAFKYYTHFTSPIRRYPDLIIHRLLSKTIASKKISKKWTDHLEESLPDIAAMSSERERRADEAERDITDLKKVQFMQDKVGEVCFGHISGITSFGIFVELEEYFVEGLIHVSSMSDDYYHYAEKSYSMIGENRKRIFRIGDRLEVKIVGVSLERRQIEFNLIKSNNSPQRKERQPRVNKR